MDINKESEIKLKRDLFHHWLERKNQILKETKGMWRGTFHPHPIPLHLLIDVEIRKYQSYYVLEESINSSISLPITITPRNAAPKTTPIIPIKTILSKTPPKNSQYIQFEV